MGSIPISIDELVGNTPVVEMTAILGAGSDSGARLFAKLEAFNPGGSVKDRIGVAMIEAAERDGLIVITSYSIHYTKLYEGWRGLRTGRAERRRQWLMPYDLCRQKYQNHSLNI